MEPHVSKTSPNPGFFAFSRILDQFWGAKMEPESSKFHENFTNKIKLFSRTICYWFLVDFTSKIDSKIALFANFFENVDLVKNIDFT